MVQINAKKTVISQAPSIFRLVKYLILLLPICVTVACVVEAAIMRLIFNTSLSLRLSVHL